MANKRKYSTEPEKGPKRSKTSSKMVLKKLGLRKKFGTKSESSPEVKFIDTAISDSTTVSSTGVVALINGCTEGTDAINRIGRKIEMTSIQYNMVFQANLSSMSTSGIGEADVMKFAVVYDRQTNGAAPAWSDVYDQNTASYSPFAHRNINNLDRFEVLAEEIINLSSGGPNGVCFSRYIKTKHDVRFNTGNAGTSADIQTGGLYILYADQVALANHFGILTGKIRVRFHDL